MSLNEVPGVLDDVLLDVIEMIDHIIVSLIPLAQLVERFGHSITSDLFAELLELLAALPLPRGRILERLLELLLELLDLLFDLLTLVIIELVEFAGRDDLAVSHRGEHDTRGRAQDGDILLFGLLLDVLKSPSCFS